MTERPPVDQPSGSFSGSPHSATPHSPAAPTTGSTMVAVPALSAAMVQEQRQVFLLMMLLNFTTRGAIAVYETQGSQILLDDYGLSQLQLGAIVSSAGVLGTIQLAFFKQFWTKNFSDINLMMGGLVLLSLSQFLVINVGPDGAIPLWSYLVALYSMYSFGYPIANSAVLGSFSTKAGQGTGPVRSDGIVGPRDIAGSVGLCGAIC
mmetsp:Transcript_14258/g.21219  ORF Transcript_14258/g.21219 Transcript_14258/m.21219 type:complete len:206 (+) Transcript_14258:522-1139(+)